MNPNDNQKELDRTYEILIATVDYQIDLLNKAVKQNELNDITENLRALKPQIVKLYEKGNLAKLKRWLRDLTEMPRECRDLSFTTFIKKHTGYDFNIFEAFYKRIDNIVAKGKISTENQYREVDSLVNFLCQTVPVDNKKIEILNKLLVEYNDQLSRKRGNPNRLK
jgi:polyhydroxyalkanoate synthesis regulator phasin